MYLLFLLWAGLFGNEKNIQNESELTQMIFLQVNQERREHRLDTLIWNDDLGRSTQNHASEMAKHNFFSHYNSINKRFYSPSDRMKYYGYRYQINGETNGTQTYSLEILPSKSQIARKNIDAWKKSKVHADIIFSPQYRETAVSVVSVMISPNVIKYYIVQNFGSR